MIMYGIKSRKYYKAYYVPGQKHAVMVKNPEGTLGIKSQGASGTVKLSTRFIHVFHSR
jgi:hypothetical protein